MQVEFVDPAHNATLQDLKNKARVGLEHIKRHQEQNSLSPEKEIETYEKNVAPGDRDKLAARQQQQNRAQRVHTANEEQEKEKERDKGMER